MLVNIIRQYFKIVATALIGVAFAFAGFFFFLNFYHYGEVRRVVEVDFSTNSLTSEFNSTVKKIEENIASYKAGNYHGSLSYNEVNSMANKLNVCLSSLKNKAYEEVRSKNVLDIRDVYSLADSFDNDILNNCIVSELYVLGTDQSPIKDNYIKSNKSLLKSYMDDLLTDGNYLMQDLYNNSSYYFNTDIISMTVKNNTRDGFYEVMSNYNKSANFIYLISEWYKSRVTSQPMESEVNING